ncbi:MAG: hypothetical protein FWD23_02325 [Oscillospiraceae bacterium]|nr:hypothetical protein [Oscillospiraceae bacterium]
MLEIKPIQTKQEQQEICGLCSVEFDAGCLAYGAKEGADLLAVAQFRIHGGYAVIYSLALAPGVRDFEALAATGKAALAFIYSCSVGEVFFKTEDEELAKALKFKKSDAQYSLDLNEYFSRPCSF